MNSRRKGGGGGGGGSGVLLCSGRADRLTLLIKVVHEDEDVAP